MATSIYSELVNFQSKVDKEEDKRNIFQTSVLLDVRGNGGVRNKIRCDYW